MARPKKEKELRHKHQIMLRLTDTEYEIISENAKSANLPLAEYVRKQVMKQKVIAKYEIVADLPELKKLVKGVMIESYLEAGCQKVGEHVYGKSITDPCLGWQESEELIYQIAEMNQ